MDNNHLTYLKIENFKKFECLEVKDIGQFNLIVGDNNVGKTCLLEALLFDEEPIPLIINFREGLTKRGMVFEPVKKPYDLNDKIVFDYEFPQGNYFKQFERNGNKKIKFHFNTLKEKDKEISISIISVSGEKKLVNSAELIIPFTNHVISLNEKSYNVYSHYDESPSNFPLICFNDTPLEDETIKIYETLNTKQEKDFLIKALKILNNNIIGIDYRENFKDLKSVFLISFEDKDEFVPLNYLGDGFRRIFYIILKTISLRGKRIMIDEVDIGIHYSKMKKFWVNLIRICIEMDVQLFATTHSHDCVVNYVEALETVKCEEKAREIKLEEYKGELYASTFLFENIESGLLSNLKMLG